MSWYVETLLKNKYRLKNNIFDYQREDNNVSLLVNLDDDSYNDIIQIEKLIEDLFEKGFIAPKEVEVLNAVSTGKSMNSLEKEIGIGRLVISKIFSTTCEKIAYILGGYFTDEGFINYMINKYKLNESQIEMMEKYMEGTYKSKTNKNIGKN